MNAKRQVVSFCSGAVLAGVAAVMTAQVNSSPAQAIQPQPQRTPATAGNQLQAQRAIIYVDSMRGNDGPSNGNSEAAPVRTITYALERAQPGTMIMLAPGIYNAGETFPLNLKDGVTIKGDEAQQGQDVTIMGGGNHVSRQWARQNSTIVAAGSSQIIGVTVTNSNIRGTGVWVENGNPTIVNSTFKQNNREGIFVTGGAPKITNNKFIGNGGNGVSVAGSAAGEIRKNLFQRTGFGITVGGAAKSVIAENQIRDNKSGLVIGGSASPMVEGNTIENNSEYGIISIGQGQPNVTATNIFAGNRIQNHLASVVAQGVAPTPTAPVEEVAVASPRQTSFSCVEMDNGYATMAQASSAIPQPMIMWQRTNLGPDMTPERRCQIVTQKLNNVVNRNGGSVSNLSFIIGSVDGFSVVCLVQDGESCSQNNMLFTLSAQNARRPGEVLQNLMAFNVTGTGNTLSESSGGTGRPTARLSELDKKLQPEVGLWFLNPTAQ